MKKIIVAIVFFSVFNLLTAFSGDDTVNAHIANSLFLIFKISNRKTLVTANDYYETTLNFKGTKITAYKCKTGNWTGFFKTLKENDLPPALKSFIHKNYAESKFENAVLYFSDEGELTYFAGVSLNKKNIILQTDPSGNVKEFIIK